MKDKMVDPELSLSGCIGWLALFGTESVAIVTMNAFTIIVYLKEPRLRKRSMYLVISLAVADMFVGVFVLFFRLNDFENYCLLWKTNLSPRAANISFAMGRFFVVASVTSLPAISLERMHATFRPIKHRLINNCVFGAAVGSVWSTASLLMVVDLLDSTKFFKAFFFLLSCCLFIIFASYTAVVVKMYCGSPPQHHGAVNRERKLTKTLLMVTTISLLLSLPHIIFFFRSFLNVSSVSTNLSYRSSLPRHLNFVLFFLYYANSLANPILYALRLPELRRALLTCLRCRCQSVRVFPHHP
ncbi:uncharacterized protein LOC141877358 [Acropora palmata]|uniref:uncharacterized protein LOC141877358 n=1 Tax=Acropora palmata TaxID=6131 RepID=UPI003DA0B065